MATARGLLEALAEAREEAAWEWARELAQLVLDDEQVKLANFVLDGGPFAMRKAEELAEWVLASASSELRNAASARSEVKP